MVSAHKALMMINELQNCKCENGNWENFISNDGCYCRGLFSHKLSCSVTPWHTRWDRSTYSVSWFYYQLRAILFLKTKHPLTKLTRLMHVIRVLIGKSKRRTVTAKETEIETSPMSVFSLCWDRIREQIVMKR